MSKGSPFLFAPLNSLRYRSEWRDVRTSGMNWSYVSFNTFPPGHAPLGDVVIHHAHLANLDNDTVNPGNAWDVQAIFVQNNRPDAAKPCTDYVQVPAPMMVNIPPFLTGFDEASIWRPVHSDTNYVGLGHVVVRGKDNKPNIGKYFCVHKKYLIDAGKTQGWILNEDKMPIYRTIAGTNLFRVSDAQLYGIRDDNDIQACCTGSGAACDSWTKGSIACQTAMTDYCNGEDIKPGGKCGDWCARDPTNCDKIKNQFCIEHPGDPFCDCINALDRPDHAAFIKDKEVIYSMSIPACYFNKCKQGPYKVFTTTSMEESQQGQRCAQDLKYIDQQIRVMGDNNVLNTNQNVTENTGTTTPTPPPKQEEDELFGFPKSQVVILFLILIAVVLGYYAFTEDAEGSYGYGMQQGYYPQMQQGYYPQMQQGYSY